MSEKTLFRFTVNGATVVVRAESIRDVRRHALNSVSFTAGKASSDDVLEFCNGGGKVQEVQPAE